MIQTNEIRIGNSVFYNGDKNEIGVVTEIKQSFDPIIQYVGINGRQDLYYQTKHIKPIPLTEEWLVKFGFYKVESYVYDIEVAHDKNISLNTNEIICFIGSGLNWEVIKYPKYVHSLQNLYFELTGQELTLKQ